MSFTRYPDASQVPNVNHDGPTIVPGAENVGQAQIVSQFSKPFQLEGLFGAADAGAFGNENGEVPMDADDDGDVFFDAEEGPMHDDMYVIFRHIPSTRLSDTVRRTGNQMEYEGSSPRNPRKRSRSPSEIDTSHPPPGAIPMESDDRIQNVRQPKRQRKNKDIPDYHAPIEDHVLERMERSNPLNRKNLKREAKRARKAHKAKVFAEHGAGGEMDVDRDELQFTFMA